jgi:hypothetical protein
VLMTHQARERSHGAFILSKAFINDGLYKDILDNEGLDSHTLFKVGNVSVYPSKALDKRSVIGICNPKYDIPSRMVVIGGRIEE